MDMDRMFSPHAWGCTDDGTDVNPPLVVFPTRVGMYRQHLIGPLSFSGFPHTRGDGPIMTVCVASAAPFEPDLLSFCHSRDAI